MRSRRFRFVMALSGLVAAFGANSPAQAQGAAWYPLKLARELDDAILMLRTNEDEIGTWVIRTRGDAAQMLAHDAFLIREAAHWLVRVTIGALRRTFNRLEVSSRGMFALVDRGSCFAGTLFELALAADRAYMLDAAGGPAIVLSAANATASRAPASTTNWRARLTPV